MKLKLTKPLCFFDLETTGTDVSKDRIIEIAIIKINIDGTRESLEIRLNPGIPIPPESTLIHGINDEMVMNKPTFKDKAQNIYNFLKGCDLAGFNSDRFDIPLLVEELLRADQDKQQDKEMQLTEKQTKASCRRMKAWKKCCRQKAH